MSIDAIKVRLPEYAKDLKLNLSSLLNSPDGMTEQQLWGSLLVAAIASRNAFVTSSIRDAAAQHLSEPAINAANAAAAIMGMNNIYYRFTHLTSNKEYSTMPAKLRMNVLMNPGVDKADFELWSLVVSAINGCGMCVDSHEHELQKRGIGKEVIQTAVRIGAVVHAIAATIDAVEATV